MGTFIENQGFVYWIHLNKNDNIKQDGYVGISKDANKRFREHRSTNPNCSVIKRAIDKHGDNLIYDVIWSGSYDGAIALEEYFRPLPQIGWNIRTGGRVPSFGEDTRKKMSVSAKERGLSNSFKEGRAFIRSKQIGSNGANAKRANIYKIDGTIVAGNVCITEWCRINGMDSMSKKISCTANENNRSKTAYGYYAKYIK